MSPRARTRCERIIAVALAAAALPAVLTGCTGESAPPRPSESAASPSTSPTPTAEPEEEPTLVAGGSAEENLAYFDFVNSRLLDDEPMPGGRAIVDNLVAAGFDKASMQVTPDETSIGRDVDAVEFSVQIGESCLLGQAADSGYVGTVGRVVPSSGCLLGTTRAIDW